MSIHLYIAPAAAGKTDYLIEQVRQAARGLSAIVRVCIPSSLQAQSWRHRLAAAGGALGVRVQLFHELYMDCLDSVSQPYIELNEPVQYRLLKAIVNHAGLTHYRSLRDSPGFIHLLQNLIGELKAGRIPPERFAAAIAEMGNPARLSELADIYTTYQGWLQQQHWTDRPGLGWLAVEALESNSPLPIFTPTYLFVDGFDNFTPVQIDFLKALAKQVNQVVITLTGTTENQERPVHCRFNQTRQRLEEAFQIKAAPLPSKPVQRNPVLDHLEARFRERGPESLAGLGVITLIEASDRVAEVRSALRWLKIRLIQDELRPGEVALLARSMTPYLPFIVQIGTEFGLPLHLVDGQPLRSNPAVAALLDLLRLMLPLSSTQPEPALPYRLVIEAWRSPYFDWSALPGPDASEPIGIVPGDATLLDRVARQQRVIAGYSQWREALALLSRQDNLAKSVGFADAIEAQACLAKFERFIQRLTPPQAACCYQDFVQWLEDLIGVDPTSEPDFSQPESPATSLNLIGQINAVEATVERDLAAFYCLKEVLLSLVWAEKSITPGQTVTFPQFFAGLVGAIEATSYTLPMHPLGKSILVADVVAARGLHFQAVAVLGLAEGEFPTHLSEDPLLRNADRRRLTELGAPFNPSTESSEVEFFYETITRAWGQILLTRPLLADNGIPWKASPYWEEIRRLVEVEPDILKRDGAPPPDRVASWPELMESLSAHPGYAAVRNWIDSIEPARQAAQNTAAQIFQHRQGSSASTLFDGNLQSLANKSLMQHFASPLSWSASRLEDYHTCPFFFFARYLLKLDSRQEPSEGLDSRQLGQIYHRIFEQVYRVVFDATDLEALLEELPGVAESILEAAPEQEGFRATAWWAYTRQAIIEDVRASLIKLAEISANFYPVNYEVEFFGADELIIRDGNDHFRLHGRIDRIDQAGDNSIRIIDYKIGSSATFDAKAVRAGEKLQLPLYALAVQEALQLGEPVDGFYWHVQYAESSDGTLQKFKDGTEVGPEVAMKLAVEKAWEAVRGARVGNFRPRSPRKGCPSYCPVTGFCWHYRPRFGD